MADFLLELYSEEIPAGMQAGAAAQLERHIKGFLDGFGVAAEGLATHVAPQRIALLAYGLPQQLPDRKEEKKGPRVDAPEQAIDGFLRANGLDNTDALSTREDKKGTFYVLEIDEPGRPLAEALGEFLPDMIAGFQWPKSMRWGDKALRWVRPLRGILCVFDGALVPFDVDGIASSDVTYGHRFMAPDAIKLAKPADYLPALEKAYVLADAARREEMVQSGASALAQSVGCTLLDDAGLVRETAGLVEWPVPLLGKIDDAFMDVPEEVLISVMRTHQKYFALRSKDGKLAPYFITISNMQTSDNGAAISAGNERVLRARLSDGRFFWDQDRKATLESRLAALEKITFQAKLGTVAEKAKRIAALAQGLAEPLGAGKVAAQKAGALCKADLTSGMVYEFPELQGIMGGYYAQNDALGDKVAAAIRDHYSPLGPGDAIPETPEGRAVALADKLDTLAGFWSIDEKPTGSKDPYALRRAALGLIRILLESNSEGGYLDKLLRPAFLHYREKYEFDVEAKVQDLLKFILGRLKVYLRDQEGIAHDILDAVSRVHEVGFLRVKTLAIHARSLDEFLKTDDGANLLIAHKRANGIRRQAADDGVKVTLLEYGQDFTVQVKEELFEFEEERQLYKAIDELSLSGDVQEQLSQLARLREPVDAFFEKVVVNVDEMAIRENRIELLGYLEGKMSAIAAFELIEGK